MDLNALTSLVIEKFKDGNGYSELDDDKLFKAIYKHLDLTYRKYFYIAQQKIEDEERKGVFPNKEKYKKEYDSVEDMVMYHANKIAATNKDEV